MYSYLEISYGYGKKRRSVRVSTTIDTPTVFNTPGIPIPLGTSGQVECGDESRSSFSFNFSGQSNLSPTGSTNPPNHGGSGNGNGDSDEDDEDEDNGNGNNGNGNGNNGNGNNGNRSSGNGNNGNREFSPNSGNKPEENKPKNLNGTLKSILSVVGI